ncbi:MAG: hypothetical protein HY316_07105 [Acidobacteria bacterium]|nr:hypothetical protein [Acidobacteriota bacterium]
MFETSIRFARHNFDNLQALARFGDAKAGAIFAIVIFLVGTTATTLRDAASHMSAQELPRIVRLGFWGSWGLFAVTAIILARDLYRVVLPRVASHYLQPDKNRDLMYWKHILLHDSNESYFQTLRTIDETGELRNISDQVYELAHIVNAKMNYLNRAQEALKICVAFWIAGIIWAMTILTTSH